MIYIGQKFQSPGLCQHSIPMQSLTNEQTLEQFFEPLYWLNFGHNTIAYGEFLMKFPLDLSIKLDWTNAAL